MFNGKRHLLEAGDLFLLVSLLYDCIAGAGRKQYIAPRSLLLVCYGLHQLVLIAKLGEWPFTSQRNMARGKKKKNGEGGGKAYQVMQSRKLHREECRKRERETEWEESRKKGGWDVCYFWWSCLTIAATLYTTLIYGLTLAAPFSAWNHHIWSARARGYLQWRLAPISFYAASELNSLVSYENVFIDLRNLHVHLDLKQLTTSLHGLVVTQRAGKGGVWNLGSAPSPPTLTRHFQCWLRRPCCTKLHWQFTDWSSVSCRSSAYHCHSASMLKRWFSFV